MKNKEIAIIIPSLDPDEKLANLLNRLLEAGYDKIILVNDGSSMEYEKYYAPYEKSEQVHVLKHAVNLGKGRALKTAFNYILTTFEDCIGAVAIDSDGQHRLEDMESCLQKLSEHPTSLILGCRSFHDNSIPFRSRFGNIVTSKMMKLLCGIEITDTQTGLRVFSRELMMKFLAVKGERFEFEMNMLLFSKEHNIDIVQVPIETIYIEENKTSHFNPFVDSVRIYAVFLKFVLSSMWSFVIDIVLFSMFIAILKPLGITTYIAIATILARMISSVFNYMVNKTKVFRSNDKSIFITVKYFTLCVIQLCLSAICVTMVYNITNFNESFIKIMVDMILFLISFQIQRDWVFKKSQ